MTKTQRKIFDLLQSYFNYCKSEWYTEFEVWCEDNIDNTDEDVLAGMICSEVNYIADKLFE